MECSSTYRPFFSRIRFGGNSSLPGIVERDLDLRDLAFDERADAHRAMPRNVFAVPGRHDESVKAVPGREPASLRSSSRIFKEGCRSVPLTMTGPERASACVGTDAVAKLSPFTHETRRLSCGHVDGVAAARPREDAIDAT